MLTHCSKNMYTPHPLPNDKVRPCSGKVLTTQWEFTLALKEPGSDGTEDDRRRFKIVITQANVIDLDTIKEFCDANRQTEQTKEIMVSTLMTLLTLARRHPSHERALPTRPYEPLQGSWRSRPTVLRD